ncbi:hypothetical protein C8Q75DRAFT_808853 [Abortiporus biennis]|nr:hypothetical protein C8Q75DRAFT_808853 [Abortiporus biennis]
MALTFSLPLREVTTIPLPTSHSQHDLTFHATFSSPDHFRQAKESGVRVEMWTDLPVAGGGWHALPFEYAVVKELGLQSEPSSERVLDLTSRVEEEQPRVAVLTAKLPASAEEYDGKMFSFTYRLAHPSGHIEWLGAFGQNGVLSFVKGDSRLTLLDGVSFPVQSSDSLVSEVQVGYLNPELQWSSWAVKNSGAPILSTSHTTDASNTIVLIPHASENHTYIRIQPLILAASKGSVVSVTPSGSIVFCPSSDGEAKLHLVDASNVAQDLSTLVLSPSSQVIEYDNSSLFVLSSEVDNTDGVFPATLSIIPLSSAANQQESRITTEKLTSIVRPILPSYNHEILFFHPDHGSYVYPLEVVQQGISLVVPTSGAQLTVAPLITIPSHQEQVDGWQLSLLSPHISTHIVTPKLPELHAITLPTPPPSPPSQNSPLDEKASQPFASDGTPYDDSEKVVEIEVISSPVDTAPDPVPQPQAETKSSARAIIRRARSSVGIRSLIGVALEFAVRILLGRLFGVVGFLLALIGWKKNTSSTETVIQGVPADVRSEDRNGPEIVYISDGEEEVAETEVDVEPEVTSATKSLPAILEDDQSDTDTVTAEEDVKTTHLDSKLYPIQNSQSRPYLSSELSSKTVSLIVQPPPSTPHLYPSDLSITWDGQPVVDYAYSPVKSIAGRSSPFYHIKFKAISEKGTLKICSK